MRLSGAPGTPFAARRLVAAGDGPRADAFPVGAETRPARTARACRKVAPASPRSAGPSPLDFSHDASRTWPFRAALGAIGARITGVRGGPEPGTATFEAFARIDPEA